MDVMSKWMLSVHFCYLAQWGLVELKGLEGLHLWGTSSAAGRGAGHRGLDTDYCPGLVWRNIPEQSGEKTNTNVRTF